MMPSPSASATTTEPTAVRLRRALRSDTRHRPDEILLQRRQLACVTPSPYAVVEVRGPGPETILGLPPLLPQVRCLPQLIPELRPVGVAASATARGAARREERLVDDLHPVGVGSSPASGLPRRQEPRVDQLAEDGCRSGRRQCRDQLLSVQNGRSPAPSSGFGTRRHRRLHRSADPFQRLSAWRASAPATPPIAT